MNLESAEYCTSSDSYNNLYQKCGNSTRSYMLDLSRIFMTMTDFEKIIYLLKRSMEDWFFQGIGNLIKINIFNDSLTNIECTTFDDCSRDIDTLNYENSDSGYRTDKGTVPTDDETVSSYIDFFRENVTKSFVIDCALNSVILLTNRIVDIKDYGGQTFKEYIDIYCIEFTVILLGKSESEASEDLTEYYGYLPWTTVFSVLDYRCLEKLGTCIPPNSFPNCANLTLDSCPPISTSTSSTTITTSIAAESTSTVATLITTTKQKSNTNSTDPPPSKQNDKEKTIIIIIGSVIAVAVVFFGLCIFFYRRHQRKKRLEEIWLSHQNPADDWELTWDKLMIKNEELGSGAYGQVLQGKLLEVKKSKNGKFVDHNKEVAIKILQRYTNVRSEKNFLNEIEVMKQITGHKHVVKMIGCITVGDRICLVLKFCLYRDLLQYAKNKQAELISDFGLCVSTDNKLKNSTSNNVQELERGKLPVKWLAIESLKCYEFSLQSDIWSFGIVMYEMFSFGKTPFADIATSEVLQNLEAGNRPEQPELCSNEIYDIMTKCWNSNPSQRPSFDELITIFTVFLEFATENYGYIDVLKEETDDPKELENAIRFENC